jgi:hypothetical protein
MIHQAVATGMIVGVDQTEDLVAVALEVPEVLACNFLCSELEYKKEQRVKPLLFFRRKYQS